MSVCPVCGQAVLDAFWCTVGERSVHPNCAEGLLDRLAALTQVAEAAQRIVPELAEHVDDGDGWCFECNVVWPCNYADLLAALVAAGYAPEEKDATDG